MIIGAAGDDAEAELCQLMRECLGVGDDLGGVAFELRLQGLAEADRLGGDHVHERPPLDAGEDRLVDLLAPLLPAKHEAAARAA